MEFAGKVVNQAKADPDKDKENKRTMSASWLTCSIVETSPYPENFVKSGILYLCGRGI